MISPAVDNIGTGKSQKNFSFLNYSTDRLVSCGSASLDFTLSAPKNTPATGQEKNVFSFASQLPQEIFAVEKGISPITKDKHKRHKISQNVNPVDEVEEEKEEEQSKTHDDSSQVVPSMSLTKSPHFMNEEGFAVNEHNFGSLAVTQQQRHAVAAPNQEEEI